MKLISKANRLRSTLTGFIRSHPLITLCLIGAFVSFVGISNELWTPDEPRDAAIGRATPTLARLPSAVFGFAALLLTYALGRCFFSPVTCLVGGLILLSTA